MQLLKDYLKQYGPLAILLISTVSYPLYSAVQAYQPAQITLKTPEFAPDTSSTEILTLLNKIVDREPETHTVRQKEVLQPVPEPMINAITKMSKDIENLAKLVEQDRELISQLKRSEATPESLKSLVNQAIAVLNGRQEVDRSGNTKEELDDIYSDVEVPVLPDAMAKGLAKHPGSRVIVHPEVGIPVLADTEWIETHGGRVLQLKRHNGRERPVTIQYSAPSTPAPAPEKKPAFNLNLGNN